MIRPVLTAALLAVLAACGSQERLVVAAGTTVVDSGLMDLLVATYEQAHPGVELAVVPEATAQILELGRRGAADVLVTHAPAAEASFLASEEASRYEEVFRSRFILVGPPLEGAVLSGLEVGAALRTIAEQGFLFVSRADGSGTHAAEVKLWRLAGVEPAGQPWYLETGQGMGLTLQVADQRRAFTLTELGAFRRAEQVLSLVEVTVAPHRALVNPYHAIITARSEARDAAEEFVDWLVSEGGQAAIEAANQELFGAEPVYRLP